MDRRDYERLEHSFQMQQMSRDLREGSNEEDTPGGVSSLEQLNSIVANIPTWTIIINGLDSSNQGFQWKGIVQKWRHTNFALSDTSHYPVP